MAAVLDMLTFFRNTPGLKHRVPAGYEECLQATRVTEWFAWSPELREAFVEPPEMAAEVTAALHRDDLFLTQLLPRGCTCDALPPTMTMLQWAAGMSPEDKLAAVGFDHSVMTHLDRAVTKTLCARQERGSCTMRGLVRDCHATGWEQPLYEAIDAAVGDLTVAEWDRLSHDDRLAALRSDDLVSLARMLVSHAIFESDLM